MKPHHILAPAFGLLGLLGLLVGNVHAHGDHPAWKPPAASTTGIERGVQFALSCDHTIHELLAEYESCLGYYAEQMERDPAAATAYWYVATIRARSALQNGYPDATQFLPVFESRYRAAQARQVVPESRLCRAIDAPCPPEPAASKPSP